MRINRKKIVFGPPFARWDKFVQAALLILFVSLCLPLPVLASGGGAERLDLTADGIGYFSLFLFILAYGLVMAEEFTHLRKSKPVILAAGLIWGTIGAVYAGRGMSHAAEDAVRHNLLEYAELFLFLLVAMTYINVLQERMAFETLRAWLVRRGFGFRRMFWITGILAFFISPLADNLTTALLMCAVVMAVGADNPKFVCLACINIVVAANAGGAFSPFGDITTLMVWQKGIIDFWTFFHLFIPSVVNFLVPAALMHFAVPNAYPPASSEIVRMKRGGLAIMGLFLCTIITAVSFHNFLGLPPVLGMMTGLGYLKFYAYYLKMTDLKDAVYGRRATDGPLEDATPFNIFNALARSEWDTLMFFYGVILCVGGLGFIGYLGLASHLMYIEWGPTYANVMVGILSAIVDNIPIMFAVLTMNPDMSQGQWLLVTLTAGVGGSMLSIGSAAGVALMGQTRGKYTFFSHLKWTPAIALGYAASIGCHLWINADLF